MTVLFFLATLNSSFFLDFHRGLLGGVIAADPVSPMDKSTPKSRTKVGFCTRNIFRTKANSGLFSRHLQLPCFSVNNTYGNKRISRAFRSWCS